MKHQTSAALYDYWLSCHGDAAVRAGVISAIELAPLLPEIFLIDLDPAYDFRFRFCGAAIASRYGRDLTDESFLALWTPDDRRALVRDLISTASLPAGMVAGVMGETAGSGFIFYEMLLLPLIGEHGGAGVLGSMARIGGHDERNRVRGRIVGQALRSVRFLPAAPRPPAARARMETPTRTHPAPPPRRYGHLTVVVGGK